MGKRQDYLKYLVLKSYTQYKHRRLKEVDFVKSEFNHVLNELYVDLGGQAKIYPVNVGPWDISTSDFVVELDEELHFNRYRYKSLLLNFYQNHTYFDLNSYLSYCEVFETACIKAGGYSGKWKNSSTEKMFSFSNEYKNLEGNGSSRWKQRAYYDLVKDITGKITGIQLLDFQFMRTIIIKILDNS